MQPASQPHWRCPACCDPFNASKPVQLLLECHRQCCACSAGCFCMVWNIAAQLYLDHSLTPVLAGAFSAALWHIWGPHPVRLRQGVHHPHSNPKDWVQVPRCQHGEHPGTLSFMQICMSVSWPANPSQCSAGTSPCLARFSMRRPPATLPNRKPGHWPAMAARRPQMLA